MLSYIQGFLALFVLVAVVLYLPPGRTYQKYIRFFAELVLTIGILMPLLSLVYDSEKFLALVDYEEFTEELSGIAKDMERVEYIRNDGYIEEYERAISEDVRLLAEQTGEAYGYQVQDARVTLSSDYTVERIDLWIAEQTKAQIAIERISLGEAKEEDAVYAGLVQKLSDYYQVDRSAIEIRYMDDLVTDKGDEG